MRDGEVIELERSFWQAMKDRDGATAARLNDESSIVIGAQGVGEVTRAEIAPMIDEAPYTLHRFAIDEGSVRVRQVSDDTVIAAYTVHELMTVDGEKVELDAHDASVWVRKDGGWVCVMHTEAIAGDPFGRVRKPARAKRRPPTKSGRKPTRKPVARRTRAKAARKRA